MKPIPFAIVLVVSIVAGAFVSQRLESEAGTPRAAERSEEARRAEVRKIAGERFAARLAEEDARRASEGGTDGGLADTFAARERALEGLRADLAQLVDGIQFAEMIYDDPTSRAERDVTLVATKVLRDPVRMARLLLDSGNEDLRVRGVRLLEGAVRDGSREAADLLFLLWTDPQAQVSAEARRRTVALAERVGDDEAQKTLLADAGLTNLLVQQLNSEEGRRRRDYLSALGALKHPAAEQGWLDIFNRAESEREKGEAARELLGLGRRGPYDQLVQQYGSALRSQDGQEFQRAVGSLRNLGGDGARTVLQAALDADPDGDNARTLRRAIQRLGDGNNRRGPGGGGGFGGRGGGGGGGFGGGGRGGD